MAIGSNVPAARRARMQGDAEVEKLISDMQDLIAQIGQPADPALARLCNRVADAVGSARQALSARGAQLQQRAHETFDAGDSYVRDRPWQMIGAAAVAGVVLGLLVSRR